MSQLKMPALFVGHGSPMNAIEDNRYTEAWHQLGQSLPAPKAILVISAHWYTRDTAVTAMSKPRTIHDFGGFPQQLFDVEYPAPGSLDLAERVKTLLAPLSVATDTDQWGLDHGTWSILVKMYPQANIPVVQLSIDGTQPADYHYQLGRKLAALRQEGILIIGSGNVVHNLRMLKWQAGAEPFPWAVRFEQFVRQNLTYSGQAHPLVAYEQHPDAAMAAPSADHYLPLLYILGLWDGEESLSTPIEGIEMASLSMLSVKLGE